MTFKYYQWEFKKKKMRLKEKKLTLTKVISGDKYDVIGSAPIYFIETSIIDNVPMIIIVV